MDGHGVKSSQIIQAPSQAKQNKSLHKQNQWDDQHFTKLSSFWLLVRKMRVKHCGNRRLLSFFRQAMF